MSPAVILGRRARAVILVLAAVFAVLVGKLYLIQVAGHQHYSSLAKAQLTQTMTVPAVRGGIYDRDGEVLAETVTKQTVVADPMLITDPAHEADVLAPVLGLSPADLRADLTERSGFVYLAHRVSDAVAAKVKSLALTGINLVPETQRVYPSGELASPVVGTVNYEGNGSSGLEYQYQQELAGVAGTEDLLEAPDGVVLSSSTTGDTGDTGTGSSGASSGSAGDTKNVAPRDGTGLELTLDESVQYVAEQALASEISAAKATGGVAIVMDVKTGDILADANLVATPGSGTGGSGGSGGSDGSAGSSASSETTTTPAATPGDASGSSSGSQADTLPAGVEEAPSNSTVTQVYEPGSVFKLVTFSAALQDGLINPDTTIGVPSQLPMGTYIFHDAESHGAETMTASQILAQSSNLGTIKVAQMLGENRLLAQIGNLGFGKPTGLGFPGESQGIVPGASQWTETSIGSTPIGQDDAVTAQQVLDAYNAVADGGVFVTPRLVRGTVSPSGQLTAAAASATHRVIPAATNAQVVSMLENVVTQGTGTAAAIDGYTVAGKTGTAQIPNPSHLGYVPGAYIGSFAGFAPAQDPVLSCLVVLDHPTPIYGGAVAAPVFSTIMSYALHHYGVPTTATATTSTSAAAVGASGTVTVPAGAATEG